MIGIGWRLAVSSGWEGAIRLAVTALAVAIGVTLLLFALAAAPALHARDVRDAWLVTSEHNSRPAQNEARTDPLLWRMVVDRYRGQPLFRVDVAPLGPHAPVPPGLSRLPGPGRLAASPALAALLARTDPTLLGDRFPGQVVATIGRAALSTPDELVVIVGHTPTDLANQGRDLAAGDHPVARVTSTEAAPLAGPGFMRLVVVIGAIGLLMSVMVFVATSTRLAAARRERRLAALRLAGATPGQTTCIASLEALVAGVAGSALGIRLFFAARPLAVRVPLAGRIGYPSDLVPNAGQAVVAVLAVPLVAVGAALISLRGVRTAPLGVARRSRSAPPTWRRLAPLIASWCMFGLAIAVAAHDRAGGGKAGSALPWLGLSFALVVVGVALAGPWLTSLTGCLIARGSRRPSVLIAGRRLADDPRGGFRAISGVVLAVFLVSAYSGTVPSAFPSASGSARPQPVGLVPRYAVAAIVAHPFPRTTDEAALLSAVSGTVQRRSALQLPPPGPRRHHRRTTRHDRTGANPDRGNGRGGPNRWRYRLRKGCRRQ